MIKRIVTVFPLCLAFSILVLVRCSILPFVSGQDKFPKSDLSLTSDLDGDGDIEEVSVYSTIKRNSLKREGQVNIIKITDVDDGLHHEVWATPKIYGTILSLSEEDIDGDGLKDVYIDLSENVFLTNDMDNGESAGSVQEMPNYDYFITFDPVVKNYELRPVLQPMK